MSVEMSLSESDELKIGPLDLLVQDHQDVIDELKRQFPAIQFIEFDDVEQVFGVVSPSPTDMNLFMQQSSNAEARYAAMFNLVGKCIKYPQGPHAQKVLNENAGLVMPLFNELAEMCKLSAQARRKKL